MADWLDKAQQARLDLIGRNRRLWRGEHRQVFLDGRITQFPFDRLRGEGGTAQPYVTYNVLRLVSTTLADLLLGEEPVIRIDDEIWQNELDDLADRSELHRVVYDAVLTASWAGEAMVQLVRYDGRVFAQGVPAGEVLPLGERSPDGQFEKYARYATATAGGRTLLLETTWEPGVVRRRCWEIAGGTRQRPVPVAEWPAPGGGLADEDQTGVDAPTIVCLANQLDEGEVRSDYDESLVTLQDELNFKQTSIAVVLAKHSRPRLILDPSMGQQMLGGTGVPAMAEVLFARPGEEPRYLSWDAQLASAIADRQFTLDAMCVAAELSPVLLGISRGATPDSARKLRLEATKSLSRAKRKASYVRPFVRWLTELALRLEGAGRPVAAALPAEATVAAELRDGLPVDDLDEAQTLATLTGGKAVMSRRRAVERQLTDRAAAEAELAELERESQEAMPPLLERNAAQPAEPAVAAVDEMTSVN